MRSDSKEPDYSKERAENSWRGNVRAALIDRPQPLEERFAASRRPEGVPADKASFDDDSCGEA